MYLRTTEIGPNDAQKLVKNNTLNRTLRPSLVDKYAADMLDGNWKVDGSTVKVGTSGRLLDGQHRLHACIKANVPFTTAIAYDVDESTFDVIDTVRPRTLPDVLGIEGHKNGKLLAGIAARVYQFDRNELGVHHMNTGTKLEHMQVIADNPGILEAANMVTKLRYQKVSIGTIVFLFGKKYPATKVAQFVDELHTGAGLTLNSPVRRLRERLAPRGGRTNAQNWSGSGRNILALCFAAANAFFQNRELKSLSPESAPFTIDKPKAMAARAKK